MRWWSQLFRTKRWPFASQESTETYHRALIHGIRLKVAMDADPIGEDPKQSKFTFMDLKKNGWASTFCEPGAPEVGTGLQLLLQNYNIDHRQSTAITWNHRSTDGYYDQSYNVAYGTIIARFLYSPKHSNVSGKIPRLSHWSDVTSQQWQRLVEESDQRASLLRVVHINITNPTTIEIINRAVNDVSPLEYPGRTFTSDNAKEFLALLGSPNAAGTAWMLAEHKAGQMLGWKYIESVQVWCDKCLDQACEVPEEQHAYNLVMHITDKGPGKGEELD